MVDNLGVRAKVAAPEFIGDYNYVLPTCNILTREKHSAECWFHSQDVEIVRADLDTWHALWSLAAFEIEAGKRVSGDTCEDRVLILPVLIVWN